MTSGSCRPKSLGIDGPGDVGVENADAAVLAAQTDREQRGDERLSDAALARHDRNACAIVARPLNAPGARRAGCRSSSAIGGTRPRGGALVERRNDRLDAQAVRARALLDRLVLAHAASAAAQAEGAHDLGGDRQLARPARRYSSAGDDLDVNAGMASSFNLRTARGYAPAMRSARRACSPAAAIRRCARGGASAAPMFVQAAAARRVRLR